MPKLLLSSKTDDLFSLTLLLAPPTLLNFLCFLTLLTLLPHAALLIVKHCSHFSSFACASFFSCSSHSSFSGFLLPLALLSLHTSWIFFLRRTEPSGPRHAGSCHSCRVPQKPRHARVRAKTKAIARSRAKRRKKPTCARAPRDGQGSPPIFENACEKNL